MRYGGIEVKAASDKRCCNSCYARNYDEEGTTMGARVDKILSIRAGQTVITVCEECARKLIESLGEQIGEL